MTMEFVVEVLLFQKYPQFVVSLHRWGHGGTRTHFQLGQKLFSKIKLYLFVFVRPLYFDTFVMLWLLCRVCSIIFAHGFDPLLPRIKLGEEHAVLLGCLKSEFYGCSVTCWIPANVYYRQYSLMTFSAVPFLHIKACKYCFKTRWITWAKLFLWAFFTKIGDTL